MLRAGCSSTETHGSLEELLDTSDTLLTALDTGILGANEARSKEQPPRASRPWRHSSIGARHGIHTSGSCDKALRTRPDGELSSHLPPAGLGLVHKAIAFTTRLVTRPKRQHGPIAVEPSHLSSETREARRTTRRSAKYHNCRQKQVHGCDSRGGKKSLIPAWAGGWSEGVQNRTFWPFLLGIGVSLRPTDCRSLWSTDGLERRRRAPVKG